MSSKIKITALFAAAVLIVSAAGCKHDSGKEESSAPAVSDNSGSSQSTEEVLPENQRVTEKFEDTKLGKYKYVWGDEFNTDTPVLQFPKALSSEGKVDLDTAL